MGFLSTLPKTKRGMLIAVVAMFSYIPLAGIMTSYSSIASEIAEHYHLSPFLESALNSFAFGITVGLCPFSSVLFLKYGYRPVAMVGYCGAALALLVSAVTTNQYVLFFSYSIVFATFNNFAYNSLISIVGEWLAGTAWVASGTVLVSCGISLGTFMFNPLTTWLNNNSKDLNAKNDLGTKNDMDDTDYLFENAAERIYYRFLICGVYILVGGALFYLVSDEPPKFEENTKDSEMNKLEKEELKESKSSTKSEKLMDFSVFSDLKVWAWLIGTTLWSLMFTVPLTNGVDIITTNYQYLVIDPVNNTETMVNMTKDQATSILSMNGFVELGIRFLCILVGPKLPNWSGSYGYIYAFTCFLLGFLTYISTLGNTEFLAWAFFLLLPLPVGVMNGMIFGGTANIFGNLLVKTVWPFTNVLLAVGFTLGPIVFTEVKDMFDIVTSLRIFSIIACIGAVVMFWLGFAARKMNTN